MKTPRRIHQLTMIAALLAASPAMANKILQDGVDDITLSLQKNSFDVVIRDQQAGKSIATVNIQPVTTQLSFPLTSTTKCGKQIGRFNSMSVGFGAFNPTFLDALVVHNVENPEAGFTDWAGGLNGGWVTEAAGTFNYQVSLADLKNPAKENHQLDPVAEFNKAMDQFISNGGSKLDWLKQDRTVEVQRTLSAIGRCWAGGNNFDGKKLGTITAPVTIRIKYQGKPDLTNVNIALGQQQGGIQVGVNPLKVTEGEILPYAPNYVGVCPADLKFRVNLKGGGKGQVKVRINEGNTTKYESQAFDFDGGQATHEFTVNIPYFGPASLNNKVSRNAKLYVVAKDEKQVAWPAHYQYLAEKAWSHTCTPQVGVGLGGVGPGGGVNLAPKPGDTPSPGIGVGTVKAPAALPQGPGFAPPPGSPQPPAPTRQVAPAQPPAPVAPQLNVAPAQPGTPSAPQLNVAPVPPGPTPPATPQLKVAPATPAASPSRVNPAEGNR